MTVPPVLTFSPDEGGIPLDLQILIGEKLLVQANSGGGKSWMIRYLLEQTHGRVQHIVIDREGEFATLREQFPYLLVGSEGEIPADLRAAKLLPRKLLELGVSTIIDLSDLKIGEQREYVAHFIGAMNHLPRELWRDVLVIVDEAQIYAPETGKVRGSLASKEELAMAASTWRKRGYCLVLATQRLAKIDKDVVAELHNKVIGRTSDNDLKRAGEELDLDKQGTRELRSMTPGTFWAYGPSISIDPVLVRSGPIQTHPPKRGALREPAPPTPAAIASITSALADLPRQAQEEAQTIEELRQQIGHLRSALQHAEREAQEPQIVDRPVVDEAAIAEAVTTATAVLEQRWRAKAEELLKDARVALDVAVDNAAGEIERIAIPETLRVPSEVERLATVAANRAPWPAVSHPSTRTNIMRESPPCEPFARANHADGALSGPKLATLNAIAQLNALGIAQPNVVQVALLRGVSHTTGTFKQDLRELVAAGYVARESGLLKLTSLGRGEARAATTLRSLRDLQDAWYAALPAPRAAILREVARVYPRAIARPDLAARLGKSHTTGTFKDDLRKLRDYGLVMFASGSVAATPMFFPQGLR